MARLKKFQTGKCLPGGYLEAKYELLHGNETEYHLQECVLDHEKYRTQP